MASGGTESNSSITKVYMTCFSSTDSSNISVKSGEYVVLILALNSKVTSHLMFVPYKNALDMSSHLVQISHNAQDKSVTVKLVGKSGQKSFTAVIMEKYDLIRASISTSDPFLVPVAIYWQISAACMSLTSLPLILNEPLPRHLKFLSETEDTARPVTPPSAAAAAAPAPPPVTPPQATPPTPAPSTPSPRVTKREAESPAKRLNIDGVEDCPVCKSACALQTPEHVAVFAKHYYRHYPLATQLIPVFIQTILRLKQLQNSTVTVCPLDFCSLPLPAEQTLARHVRRKHQFEVLLLHMLMKDREFLNTSLYTNLLSGCQSSKVRDFIKNLFHTKDGKREAVKQESADMEDVTEKDSEEKEEMSCEQRSDVSDEIKDADASTESSEKVISAEVPEAADDVLKESNPENKVENITSKDQNEVNSSVKVSEDIITKKARSPLDKAKATNLMKQFFRQNYEDKDCQSFLTSRGEVLTVKVFEKLACFIYLMASDEEEASQLVLFALKNLKTVLEEGKASSKEVLQIFQEQLNSVYNLISEFKNFCEALKLSPTKCNKNVLISILQSLTSGVTTENRNIFLKWLSSVHDKVEDKLLVDHGEFSNVPDTSYEVDMCEVMVEYKEYLLQCQDEDHVKNATIIREYVIFCNSRDLDPVSHSDFQAFIFFLRYIYSLSVGLKLSMKYIMGVVSLVHSNFNKLLNVNESIDVTDEVISKLSATEPAVLFCFSCSEGFLGSQEASEHFAQNECLSVRCVICKSDVDTSDLDEHLHGEDCGFGPRVNEATEEDNIDVSNISVESGTNKEDEDALDGTDADMESSNVDEVQEDMEDEVSVQEESIVITSDPPEEENTKRIESEKVDVTLEERVESSVESKPKNVPESPDKREVDKGNVEWLPASEYAPKFHLNFDANIPAEEETERIDCDVTLSEILAHKGAPPRVKTIVDHCVDKRKAEADPRSLEFPLSWIRYKKLRMDVGLSVNCKEAVLPDEVEEVEDEDDGKLAETSECQEKLLKTKEMLGLDIVDVKSVDVQEFKREKVENKKESIEDVEKFEKTKELLGIDIIEVKSRKPEQNRDLEEPHDEIKIQRTKELLGIDIIEVKSTTLAKDINIDRTYKPMNFNIPVCDIALESQWKDYLDPQVEFLKKKVEALNRWKNDINYYFNVST